VVGTARAGREDGGCIYGQKDLGCDTSDRVVFDAVGKILPRNAVWYASNLKRTHQTADAIWPPAFPSPPRCRTSRTLPNSISANGRA